MMVADAEAKKGLLGTTVFEMQAFSSGSFRQENANVPLLWKATCPWR